MHRPILSLLTLLFLTSCNHESLSEKAEKIHERIFTIDSHTDTPLWFTRSAFDLNTRHDSRETRSRVDFPRMKEGGLDGIFFAAFVGQGERTPEANAKVKERINRIIDSIYTCVERYPEVAEIVTSPDEAYRCEREGRKAVFIGIENGYPVGTDISNVKEFYNRGVRYITLCHSANNEICDSSTDTTEHNGLSAFGEEVVKEMNRFGIMIDVSHISDSSFYDVINLSEAPVIASHSSIRAVRDNPRNLTDDMLQKLAANGGVIQICILSDYIKDMGPNPERDSAFDAIRIKYKYFKDLSEEEYKQARQEWIATDKKFPRKLATVSDMVDHIDHAVSIAGIDHVGIGTDFDGGGGLSDCYDVSEMGNITMELLKRGYSEEEIEKIWGRNLMRVMREVEEYATTRRQD